MPTFTFQTQLSLPTTSKELHARIRNLTAIKDELDRELVLLMGKKRDFEPGMPWHCLRCNHSWISRLAGRPRMCPGCRSRKFDRERQYVYKRVPVATLTQETVRPAPLPHSVVTRPYEPPVMPPPVEEDLASVALSPPPVPARTIGIPLRERLALLNAAAPTVKNIEEKVLLEEES